MRKIKTTHTLKKALVVIPVYGTGQGTKSDEFLERFQTAVDPHPHPSEWSLSHHVHAISYYLVTMPPRIYDATVSVSKNLQHVFLKMSGGGSKAA